MHSGSIIVFLACSCVYVTSLELNDFRTPAWTDESLETVLDLYSSTTDCDQTDSNSSCAKCLSADALYESVSLTTNFTKHTDATAHQQVTSHQLSAYLLSLTLAPNKYCGNMTEVSPKLTMMIEDIGLESNNIDDSLRVLMSRLEKVLNKTSDDHGDHKHSDHQSGHTGSGHDHQHGDDNSHDHDRHGQNDTHSQSHDGHDHGHHNQNVTGHGQDHHVDLNQTDSQHNHDHNETHAGHRHDNNGTDTGHEHGHNETHTGHGHDNNDTHIGHEHYNNITGPQNITHSDHGHHDHAHAHDHDHDHNSNNHQNQTQTEQGQEHDGALTEHDINSNHTGHDHDAGDEHNDPIPQNDGHQHGHNMTQAHQDVDHGSENVTDHTGHSHGDHGHNESQTGHIRGDNNEHIHGNDNDGVYGNATGNMSDHNAEHGNHITNATQHDHNETHAGHIHDNDTKHIHGNVTGNTNDHADGHNHSDHGHDHEHKDTDGGQHNHGDHHPHDKTHTTTKATQCFGYETLMHELSYVEGAHNPAETAMYMIVSHLLNGDKPQSGCELKPIKSDVIASLVTLLTSDSSTPSSSVLTYSEYESLINKVRPKGGSTTDSHVDDHGHIDTHDHSAHSDAEDHSGHVHKRAIKQSSTALMDKCLNADEIVSIFGIRSGSNITTQQLPDISLALVQQLAAGHCQASDVTTEKPTQEPPTDFQKWGLSTISVAVISSLALLGGVLFPCMNHDFVQDVLTLFIGLAIGTMAGDALLHLIPQALGLHDHSGHDHEAHEGSGVVIEDYSFKMLAVTGAIYAFFLFELLMSKFGHSHLQTSGHNHNHTGSENNSTGKIGKDKGGKNNKELTTSSIELVVSSDSSWSQDSSEEDEKSNKGCKGLPTMAYMVMLGDALHNFVDGLAIGAAFSANYQSGIAISIAVLCHELPHELGDFAVLLSTGMRPKMVLLANFFCACCCFVGLYIGILVSAADSTRQWIFAVTAGMFLYISLVDLIPELARRQSKSGCKLFFLQNLGILVGFGIMFLIAAFEHQIKV